MKLPSKEAVVAIYKFAYPRNWEEVLRDHLTNGNDYYKKHVKGRSGLTLFQELDLVENLGKPITAKQMSNKKAEKGKSRKEKLDYSFLNDELRSYQNYILFMSQPNNKITKAMWDKFIQFETDMSEKVYGEKMEKAIFEYKNGKPDETQKNQDRVIRSRRNYFRRLYFLSSLQLILDDLYGGSQQSLFDSQMDLT